MYPRCDRQLARDLNEDLSLLQGILDVLASQPGLPSDARALTEAAVLAAERATERSTALQRVASAPQVVSHPVRPVVVIASSA